MKYPFNDRNTTAYTPQLYLCLTQLSCAYRISQAENLQKVAHENDRRLTSEMNDVNMIMCMNYDVSKPEQGGSNYNKDVKDEK